MAGSLSGGNIAAVTSTVITPPTGGGSFARGVRSLSNSIGVWAEYYSAIAAFTPTTKGASWSLAMQAVTPGANYAPLTFVCAGGTNISDDAYIFGIGNGDPAHLILRKGSIAGGLPDVEPATPLQPLNQGVLRRSVEAFSPGQWLHLRLMAARNANGDTVLSVARNVGAVGSAIWEPIPGMDPFVDDAAGIATGTPSYPSGFVGRGAYFAQTGRVAVFDFETGIAQ